MYMHAVMTASLRIALPITSMRLPWEYVHTHTPRATQGGLGTRVPMAVGLLALGQGPLAGQGLG